MARFLLRFVGTWLAFVLVLGLLPGIEEAFVKGTLASLSYVAPWFDPQASVSERILDMGGVTFNIVPDCTPLMPLVLFATTCLAFPARWPVRLAGLLAATVLLWGYNIARILLLVLVQARWPAAFDFVHVYLWQTTTLLAVLAVFVVWLRFTIRYPRWPSAGEPAPAPGS